jgi:hypothetical protein
VLGKLKVPRRTLAMRRIQETHWDAAVSERLGDE